VEDVLVILAEHFALALEAVAILIIGLGGLEAAFRVLWPLLRRQMSHGLRRDAWLSFARWLVLGLEFMLAADIVRTVIEPNWADLGQLGVIAVIRTFLNYFLERDLEAAAKAEIGNPTEVT
jgi:uncharacterized membrane protein